MRATAMSSGGHTPWFTMSRSSPPSARAASATARWAAAGSPRSPATATALDPSLPPRPAGSSTRPLHSRPPAPVAAPSPARSRGRHRSRARACPPTRSQSEGRFDDVADDMLDREVQLLDMGRLVGGNHDTLVDQLTRGPAALELVDE